MAYTNPFAGATSTTLYALNAATNSLATIGGLNGTPSPNGGVVTDIGPLGITFAGSTAALDIATNNTAYAVLRPAGGALTLYTINLGTGAATAAGAVGDGTLVHRRHRHRGPGRSSSHRPRALTPAVSPSTSCCWSIRRGARCAVDSVTFNGADVTGAIASCVVPGTAADGVVSLRCPNIGGVVTGPGMHTFVVRLQFNDGSIVQRAVTWNVVAVSEP